MSVGGSIQEIAIGGRLFNVAADADASRKLGGFETEVQANGNGSVRYIKTRVPWSLDGVVLDIEDVRGDQEFLQNNADSNEEVDIAITYASGITYQGRGKVVGEVVCSSQNTTATVTLSGGGKLESQ